MRLTVFQRGLLDGICRLRARLSHNVHNDATYIARALHTIPTDRPHITHAISTLIVRGFLILTNEQDNFNSLEGREESKRRVEKRKKEPSAQKQRGDTSPELVLPEDSRHTRVQALVMNAYREQNGASCPWDGGEGSQLKALLSATPGWHDGQIAQCLANMYASGGFAKGTRPREFLPRLPKYLHGPLNEFNREQGSGYVNKGKQRQDASNDAIRAALERISGKAAGDSEGSVPLLGCDNGNGGSLPAGDGDIRRGSGKAQARGGGT